MESIIKFFLLAISICFTFYIPGFVVVELFVGKLEKIVKIPLYIITSLLISTYSIYILSLVIGFSKISILIVFLFFSVVLCIMSVKRKITWEVPREHVAVFVLAIITFLLFLVALVPGIFTIHNGYIVMSGENWQDTAMHMGIIESISQGNFPPEAPYFSGQPLSYYYFVDFHAAIIETFVGGFFPRVLVYINPFFVGTFVLAVYGLAWSITRNKVISFMASFSAAFYGNLMFVNFFKDVLSGGKALELIAAKGYTINYEEVMNVSPMADYFLQNRPMMIGLPGITVILMLLVLSLDRELVSSDDRNLKNKLLFFAGFITALFVKFQLFIFIAGVVAFLVGLMVLGARRDVKAKEIMSKILFFGVGFLPGLIVLVFLKVGENSIFNVVKDVVNYKPWYEGKPVGFIGEFIFQNFGIHFLLLISSIILVIGKKFKLSRGMKYLLIVGVVFFTLPFLVRFTIYDADMFKFFYIAIIPISIAGAITLWFGWKHGVWGKVSVVFILLLISLTGCLNLGWSFFNKNFAYSFAEYNAGMWVRNNTAYKAVFLQMPTVHSATSEIGGRLRVLSYITWPYSHGFNEGKDNVFSRLTDIKNFYLDPQVTILEKYNVNYVYFGPEERSNFPDSKVKLDEVTFLTKMYEKEDISIYQVNF